MIDTVRGVLRVRQWPKKRGRPKSALQRWWNDWFRQANLLAKYADGLSQARAIELTKGTGLYPRDIILRAMRGRLYFWSDENGKIWYPMAAIQDISDSLDVIAQTIGSVLVRASDRWRPIDPGVVGKVLTSQGPGVLPEFAPVTGTAVFGGGCLLTMSANQPIPNVTFRAIDFDQEEYDTGDYHNNIVDPSRIIAPADRSWVKLVAGVRWAVNGTGQRDVLIFKNGAVTPGGGRLSDPNSDGAPIQTFSSAVIPVTAGDYLQVLVYQNSGGALDVSNVNDETFLSAQFYD